MSAIPINKSIAILFVAAFLAIAGAASTRWQATIPPEARVSAVNPAGSGSTLTHLPIVRTAPRNVATVNLPHFSGDVDEWDDELVESAMFWFGQVTMSDNYTDVRLGYDDDELAVYMATFDRQLWYDDSQNPNPATLTDWDAVTLYLDKDGLVNGQPAPSSFRFTAQLRFPDGQNPAYQAAQQGTGSGWTDTAVSFIAHGNRRASALNDNTLNDHGWMLLFRIPFSSLGLGGPPADGTVWGMGMTVHDLDSGPGGNVQQTNWPTDLNANDPSSWSKLRFDFPPQTQSSASSQQSVTIRHNLNGADVPDGTVGGHSVCGSGVTPPMFANWGNTNYDGYHQFNIQNQRDLSDWPCFAKYYVTFPLDAIPPGATIVDATLTLYQFGNAGVGWEGTPFEPDDSYIQVFTVFNSWDESTLTWNNGPLPKENFGGTWVAPVSVFPGWPGIPWNWDVSRAVAQAYAEGTPLHLALYSGDIKYNSGKYFVASDTWEGNAVGRPTLNVVIATP